MSHRSHATRRAVVIALLPALLAACSTDDPGGDPYPGELPTDVAFVDVSGEGAPAPEISLELVDGTELDVTTLWEDRPAVLVFTASWCDRCADLHRRVTEVVDDHGGAVNLLGILDEEDDGAGEYADETGGDHPVGVTPTGGWDAYAVEEPPLVALIGPGGRLLRGWPGGTDPETLAGELDGLYAGEG